MRCVAARFGVNFMSVMRWSQRLQPCLKRNKSATKIDREALKKDVGEHPDAYMAERAQRLGVSLGCVHYTLKRLGVTYKKKPGASQGVPRGTWNLPKKAGDPQK